MRLNVEQRKIIELEPNRHMLIKGAAGSGKTTMAVHRLSFLKEHYCPEDDDHMLLVTFNKTLLKYIHYQFEHLEEFREAEYQNLFSSKSSIDINDIDRIMYRYFRKYLSRHYLNNQNLDTYQEIDRIGRSEGGKGNPQKLTKITRTREAIYSLIETYDKRVLKENLIDFKQRIY